MLCVVNFILFSNQSQVQGKVIPLFGRCVFFCFLLLLLRSVNQWTVQCFSFIFDSIPIFRHILIASTKWFESLFFFACPKTPLLSHKRSVLCIQISIFPSFFFVCSHIFRFCTSKSLQNRLIYACLCPPILQLYMSEPSSFRFVHTHKKNYQSLFRLIERGFAFSFTLQYFNRQRTFLSVYKNYHIHKWNADGFL